MAVVASTGNKEQLRERILFAVQDMYTEVASCPSKGFHFPTGRMACEYVGYPKEELEAIPVEAVESFAGTGYPFLVNGVHEGDTVLDVGSGSGTDLLIAALRVGPNGTLYGLDITDAMIEKAKANIERMGVRNVTILMGNAEDIPLDDDTVDVVTSNGVLNLVLDKAKAFEEIHRILKPGGRLQIADIVLGRGASEKSRLNPQLWAECIVGAVPEVDYLNLIRGVGFEGVKVVDRIDYFDRSANPSTKNVAKQYGAISITVVGRKGE